MNKLIKKFARYIPYIGKMKRDLEVYRNVEYPPGHYYSPVVSREEIKSQEEQLFTIHSNHVPDVDLNEKEQLALLGELVKLYPAIPFSAEKKEPYRYYYDNEFYSYSDGVFLHLILRYFKHQKIIEIGSGFSSAVMLDTNEYYFDNGIALTFIEPFPERLFSLLKAKEVAEFLDKPLATVKSTLSRMNRDGLVSNEDRAYSLVRGDSGFS